MKIVAGKKYTLNNGDAVVLMAYDSRNNSSAKFVGTPARDSAASYYYNADGTYTGYTADYGKSIKKETAPPGPPQLITVYAKQSPNFPWSGWTEKKVIAPPEQENESDSSDDDDAGDDGEDDENDDSEDAQRDTGDYGHCVVVKNGNISLRYYDSFEAFIDDADDQVKSRATWPSYDGRSNVRSSRSSESGHDWSGAESFAEAIHQARFGWDEGIVKMDAITADFNSRTRWTVDKALSWDVAGSYPDVPVFLSADPENMVDAGDTRNKVKPLLHLVVERVATCAASTKAIFNFGAAVQVCIDQIEACGTRVQLDTVISVNSYHPDTSPTCRWFTTIKRPGEQMEKSRMAFALAHKGFLRRLWFSVLEQDRTLYDGYHRGYGGCSRLEDRFIPAGALYVPPLESFSSSSWDTVDKAVKALQGHLGIIAQDDGTITMATQEEKHAA